MKFGSLSIIAASIALSACVTTGGGITPDKLTRPIRADDKPYIGEKDEAHSKTSWITPAHKMKQNVQWDVEVARSGRFTKDGAVSLFVAPHASPFVYSKNDPLIKTGHAQTESVESMLKNSAYLDPYSIWKLDADNKPTELLIDLGRGCRQSHRALVEDFNQDGIDDVFVVCTGAALDNIPDSELWGGIGADEKNRIVLSDGKGGFTNTEVGEKGMYHGGSAADINGDGYPDVVVANMLNNNTVSVFFYINQKDGTFKKDTSRIVGGLPNHGYQSVVLVDVDGDGIVDLVVGTGISTTYATPVTQAQVLFGDADGKFGRERMTIPSVPGRGVILDIETVTNNGERILYVYRTSDATSGLPCCFRGAYASETMQAVNLTTGKTSIVFDKMKEMNRTPVGTFYSTTPVTERGWMPVTRNGQKGIAPANELREELTVIDGKLVGAK